LLLLHLSKPRPLSVVKPIQVRAWDLLVTGSRKAPPFSITLWQTSPFVLQTRRLLLLHLSKPRPLSVVNDELASWLALAQSS
jgi:hypothetical protein